MELSTRYDPKAAEEKHYPSWEKRGYFHADENSDAPPYCIVIPPPNITGILHMGHALNNTLQDVLIRWKRMAGHNTLWVPGTDHASIATQYVVERKLREQGMERPREQLGREKFLERVWEWKEENGRTIVQQLKRLGCSCDWERERFTMDAGLSRAVHVVFARLYEEGLIYRGNYLVNWCPRCLTTLADDEVEYSDKPGKLWYIRYPIEGMPGRFAVVATTRPETMLGDTAVAVNPGDERYRDLIGKYAILPLMNRRIPIIGDDFVDREFGTGMVKITPAHDPNDYAAGKRHGLEEINILTPDAHVNENGGAYQGLERYVARKRVVEDLQAQELIEKITEHPQRIGVCYRCHTVIEPYVSLQWFVKIGPLVDPAKKAVAEGRVQFHPESRKADYFRWLDNLRDWAISRQLWWGHQIPAFYEADGTVVVARDDAEYHALRKRAESEGPDGLRQDPDVLDTWFSSALWPFSTLGWPDQTKELATYYPTATLVTARDIIFFWVSRMIMMGLHFMKDVPFRDVYFNPIVGDEHGKKMSKSKGNAIDPIKLMDEYGTDALRITLCAYASREQHISFSVKECEGYRNFMNKLWNAARLIFSNVTDLRQEDLASAVAVNSTALQELVLEDRWILSRYARAAESINASLAAFEFDTAVKSFREFFWNDFCDYYLELVKPRLYADPTTAGEEKSRLRTQAQSILVIILEGAMRLLHPFCPFITEEIWLSLKSMWPEQSIVKSDSMGARIIESLKAESVMLAPWVDQLPQELLDERSEAEVKLLQNVVYTIRNIRGEMKIAPSIAANVLIVAGSDERRDQMVRRSDFLTTLTNIRELTIEAEAEPPAFAATGVADGVVIYVELPGELRKAEITRLEKEITRLTIERERLAAKLSNESFTSKAPPEVIKKEQAKLESSAENLKQLEGKLKALQA